MNYFVTAIGTDSGKTFVSAILCEALQADYWKPIQAGLPRDAETVATLVRNTNTKIHPEAYRLHTPASPHAAAKIDKVDLRIGELRLPQSKNTIIIEGAGGCLVPLNDHEFVIDIARHFNIQVVLVCNLYLGSINHSLLTVEALRKRNIDIKGIIFNGDRNEESERIILLHAGVPCLLSLQKEMNVDAAVVRKYAQQLNKNWNG
jgi:dethiobiotin synthetase